MKATLYCLAFSCLLGASATRGQVVLSIDFDERGLPITNTYPGFSSFIITSNTSASAAQTVPTVRTFGALTVTLAGLGNPAYDDRVRTVPTNNPAAAADFTQEQLLRDFVFQSSATNGDGLSLTIDGLTANEFYKVTIWSFDNSSTGNRVSDWTANGLPVKFAYVFNGSVLPTNDGQYQFNFKIAASGSGQVLVQGRRNAATSSAGGVFINAFQVEVTTPDAPTITTQPAGSTVYAGDNAYLSVVSGGTPPLTYQWRKGGADIPDATNRTLTILSAQAGDAALYSVVVSNASGSDTSMEAQVTVLPVENITTGLIAFWPLNQLGTTTPDAGGNGNDLNAVNMDGANVGAGRCGNAPSFNGTDEYLARNHGGTGGLPASAYQAYTVALWVKGNGVGQLDRRVFSESNSTNNTPLLNIGTDNLGAAPVVDIFIRNNDGATPINHRKSTLPAFDGNWHHIAWVDDNGFARLYIDGVQDTTDFTYTRGVLAPNIVSFGAILRATAGSFFNGMIDEPVVWRRSLSASEIQYVINNGPRLAPVVTCPPDVTVNADAGACTAGGVALGTPNTGDNCGIASVMNDAPATFPVGMTTVTWTVTDLNGNMATCTQKVTVVDNQPPVITCPADVVVNTDAGLCTASGVALGAPMTSDNCAIASTMNDASAVFPLGMTTVTWTVTDVNGNSSSCTQKVIVLDTQPPTIACPPDVTVSANPGQCVATGVALGNPMTGDNCAVASTSNNAPGSFPFGTTVVTWTVTDASGNSASCPQNVTVTSAELPIITSQPQNRNNLVGSTATFTVAVVSCTAPTYVWCFGTNAIPDATNATLTLTDVQLDDAGDYTAKISNANGSVTSAVAVLVVRETNADPVAADNGAAGTAGQPLTIPVAKLLANDTDSDGDLLTVASVSAASTNGGSVTLDGSNVIYTPQPGFTGVDRFSYTISDGFGGTDTADVEILVLSGNLPSANQVSIATSPNGVLVRFAGVPGRGYAVERSTDLNTWSPLTTVTAPLHGIIEFLDTNPPQPSAFYRTAGL